MLRTLRDAVRPSTILVPFLLSLLAVTANAQTVSTGSELQLREWPRFLGADFDGVAANAAKNIDWVQDPRFMWSIDLGEGYGLSLIHI